jgi:cell division protein ZapA (FtsZ GTPase activity inhibitor)
VTAWWIGLALLYGLVLPLVVLLLHRLRRPVLEIRRYVDDTLEHGVLAIAALDAVDELVETRDRIGTVKQQVAAYGGNVARLLG